MLLLLCFFFLDDQNSWFCMSCLGAFCSPCLGARVWVAGGDEVEAFCWTDGEAPFHHPPHSTLRVNSHSPIRVVMPLAAVAMWHRRTVHVHDLGYGGVGNLLCEADPTINAWLKNKGWTTDQLLQYFITQADADLTANGKTPTHWIEIFNAGIKVPEVSPQTRLPVHCSALMCFGCRWEVGSGKEDRASGGH